MSEPCSFTALIRMTPKAFAALMRSRTLDPLADAIARIVTDGLNDVVVFKYLKKEQALFAHRYFHYDEALEGILNDAGVSSVLAASAFKDVEAADRAVVSHDANNFKQSEPSAGFVIEPGRFRRDDGFDAETIDAFDDLLDRHFFKLAEDFGDGGGHWVKSARVIDAKLRRKVERKLEARRLLIVQERIPSATPLRPVRLFDKHHYNGRFVFWTGGNPPLPLVGIDPQTLRQTGYGAADADHVIAGGVVLRTDPARFKALRKENTTFHVSAEKVYDARMAPVSGADPETFELVHAAFARDKDRWYTHRGEPLEDVGRDAGVDDSLYFLPLVLLLGERSFYLGDRRLPVHAPSCRVVRTLLLRKDPFYGGLLWLRDEEGDCIVSRVVRFGEEPSLNVRRTSTPEACWAEEEAAWEARVESGTPVDTLRRETRKAGDDEAAGPAFIAFFEEWMSQHFDDHWNEDPYDTFVWDGVERYFEALVRAGKHERVLEVYEKFETEAWFRSQVFLHTVPAYLALGMTERAVEEIRRAVIYSYFASSKIFERPEIAALLERDDVAGLKAYAEFADSQPGKGPPLPGQLARHFLGAIPDRHRIKAVQHIFSRFHIPDAAFLEWMRSTDAEKGAIYERSLAAFVNACMLDVSTRHFPAYDARRNYRLWGDLPGLHPAVHLIAASSLYAEGFFWMDMKAEDLPCREFERAALALRRAKAGAAEAIWSEDPDWRTISSDPAFAPLLDLEEA